MDVERSCLLALFKYMPYTHLLKNIIEGHYLNKQSAAKANEQVLLQALRMAEPTRTGDELFGFYQYILQAGGKSGAEYFSLLFDLSDKILGIDGAEPYCKSEHLLRWRETSHLVGQDLFTTALYAQLNPACADVSTHNFVWRPAIRIDDARLYRILEDGMAENHYHLNGSTQIFPLTWASLMNSIAKRGKDFRAFGRYLSPQISYELEPDGHYTLSLYQKCILAAGIRAYLFYASMGLHEDGPDTSQKMAKNSVFGRYLHGNMNHLKRPELWVDALQREICALQNQFGLMVDQHYLDYALVREGGDAVLQSDYRILAGERIFLYNCLRAIHTKAFSELDTLVFHLYIVLKTTLRGELVQTNAVKGFSNFSDYELRKEQFIKGQQYQYEKIRLAVNATFAHQSVRSLEMRLCPKASAEKNQEAISHIENISRAQITGNSPVLPNNAPAATPDRQQFYVFHFPKEKQTIVERGDILRQLRHGTLRRKLARSTEALLIFLQGNYTTQNLMVGIDACANEIGCRPEVFGPAFRRLKTSPLTGGCNIPPKKTPRHLHITYHAGEDFYDIADGLRAIDEAILFCGLERGDRLGHALALGVEPDAYFRKKNHTLILPRQELLDNMAWVLQKARQYALTEMDDFPLPELYTIAKKQYLYIFENKPTKLNDETFVLEDEPFDLEDYQHAWHLRGDVPEYYENPDFSARTLYKMDPLLHFPTAEASYALNSRVAQDTRRGNAWDINHKYLYHVDVNQRGSEITTFKTDDRYSTLIQDIQRRMQQEIAGLGIGIEANPSSNMLIGQINRYVDHPLVRAWCKPDKAPQKTQYETQDEASSRLSVSINTDDQGVFDTLLENEYAIMLCALQKNTGKDESKIEKIYSWLDKVRNEGMAQSFFP